MFRGNADLFLKKNSHCDGVYGQRGKTGRLSEIVDMGDYMKELDSTKEK